MSDGPPTKKQRINSDSEPESRSDYHNSQENDLILGETVFNKLSNDGRALVDEFEAAADGLQGVAMCLQRSLSSFTSSTKTAR